MCLAIPMKVLSINGETAEVDQGGVRLEVSLMVIDVMPRVGDYVLVHAGFAIKCMDPESAAETLALLNQLIREPRPGGERFETY